MGDQAIMGSSADVWVKAHPGPLCASICQHRATDRGRYAALQLLEQRSSSHEQLLLLSSEQ